MTAGQMAALAAAGWTAAAVGGAAVRVERRRLAEVRVELADTRKAARRDYLTGVANRRGLDEVAELLASQADRWRVSVVVLFVDVDRFKAINDTFGHDTADSLLIAVAGRMSAEVGGRGHVARIGGDEFLAVLTAAPEHAADVAVDMRGQLEAALSAPYQCNGFWVQASATVGAAHGPVSELAALRAAADEQMRARKRAGHRRGMAS